MVSTGCIINRETIPADALDARDTPKDSDMTHGCLIEGNYRRVPDNDGKLQK
jgi:hypothetical protein